MAIKIIFPADTASVTAPSLHQWDYGQTLEIESADLLPIVEVHFACVGMTEAIVRPCSVNNGLATVAIPDMCLEHSGTIMAWVFEINGTEGMTRKTISIPVKSRVKPAPGGDIPTEIYDKYTELIDEMREAVEAVLAGNVTVVQAKTANYAAEAGHANSASSADTARSATSANDASWASRAGRLSISQKTSATISEIGLYLVKWKNKNQMLMTELIFIDNLTNSDIYTAGSLAGGTLTGLKYSAYTKTITVTDGTLYDIYKIADYSIAVG